MLDNMLFCFTYEQQNVSLSLSDNDQVQELDQMHSLNGAIEDDLQIPPKTWWEQNIVNKSEDPSGKPLCNKVFLCWHLVPCTSILQMVQKYPWVDVMFCIVAKKNSKLELFKN